ILPVSGNQLISGMEASVQPEGVGKEGGRGKAGGDEHGEAKPCSRPLRCSSTSAKGEHDRDGEVDMKTRFCSNLLAIPVTNSLQTATEVCAAVMIAFEGARA